MKYSILIPYFNRHRQFDNTLFSFSKWYNGRTDLEIIVVEDLKNSESDKKELSALIAKWSNLDIKKVIPTGTSTNPAPLWNAAAKAANGSFFILTSPECSHTLDILVEFDKEFEVSPNSYIVCACQSRNTDGAFHMWYQHSRHRNYCYHFCSALSSEKYFTLGGMDEIYSNGFGYEDNDFRDKVFESKCPIIIRDDLVTFHQWHDLIQPSDWTELYAKNQKLYATRLNRKK